MKKLLIIGHARHGKDTVAEMLRDKFGYVFQSSSYAAAKIFLFDALKDKYGYTTFSECFEDRVNHRAEWHDLICEYNKTDKARLAMDIMEYSDIYVGMRSDTELQQCLRLGIFDMVIGVYNPREPLEPASSFDIDIWKHSDIIIPNSGTLQDLEQRILLLKNILINENELA